MPYMPYTSRKKGEDGKPIWPARKASCGNCRVGFTTRNPNQVYCSIQCRRTVMLKKRRDRAKKEKENTLIWYKEWLKTQNTRKEN